MKKYIFLWILSFVLISAYSQEESAVDSKTTRELSKQQRIENKKMEEAALSKMVDSLVKYRQLVLEADYLSNQTGYRVIVNSLLNFIIVDSTDITIQIASTTGIGGPNGMGGITAVGHITRFEVNKVGKKSTYYSIRLVAMTSVGAYDILLSIFPSSNADATISGTTSGKLNYHGIIKSREKSKVYKGMSI
jgi:hypothetical protein